MARVIQKIIKPPIVSIKQFYERRNKILIIRRIGGLGDILMHRMIFEDVKRIYPECHLTFACPSKYHNALINHPFLDSVADTDVNIHDFGMYFDTTSACSRYEDWKAPLADKHRSDIWAEHIGVNLTSHNMHINLPQDIVDYGFKALSVFPRPIILFCPISAMVSKNLLKHQSETIINEIRDGTVVGLHASELDLPIPTISGVSIKEWMGIINAADYIISVDSAAFHFAGGIGKPLMGIFTWACGKTYGKYYDFVLVQKHRDNGNWDCGPCYRWGLCPKSVAAVKPCLTEISEEMLQSGVKKLLAN